LINENIKDGIVMSKIKKIFLVLLTLLFAVFTACQKDVIDVSTTAPTEQETTTATETQHSETESVLSTSTTTAVSTVISLSGIQIQQKELGLFLKTYKELMLEMANLLMQYDTDFIDIGFQGQVAYYDDEDGNEVRFEGEVLEKFKGYLAIAEAESKCEAVLFLRVVDGKRVIVYDFSFMEGCGNIIYMPDGYSKLPYDEETNERLLKTEIKLEDNWYSYF